jgi:hypothetical protein
MLNTTWNINSYKVVKMIARETTAEAAPSISAVVSLDMSQKIYAEI